MTNSPYARQPLPGLKASLYPILSSNNRWAYAYAYNFDKRPPLRPQISKAGQIWFDGYDAQGTVFFDEFNGEASYDEIKKITDSYDYRAQVKGASVVLQHHTVIISSNAWPANWWRGADLDPLVRRVRQGGGTLAVWGGSVHDYIDAAQIYPPDEFPWTPYYVWRAFPDPPGPTVTTDGEGDNPPPTERGNGYEHVSKRLTCP